MYELLPEIWVKPKEGKKPASWVRAKKRVLDLNVWLQSFALYEGVLVPQCRQLMACSLLVEPIPSSDLPIISLSRKASQ